MNNCQCVTCSKNKRIEAELYVCDDEYSCDMNCKLCGDSGGMTDCDRYARCVFE